MAHSCSARRYEHGPRESQERGLPSSVITDANWSPAAVNTDWNKKSLPSAILWVAEAAAAAEVIHLPLCSRRCCDGCLLPFITGYFLWVLCYQLHCLIMQPRPYVDVRIHTPAPGEQAVCGLWVHFRRRCGGFCGCKDASWSRKQ